MSDVLKTIIYTFSKQTSQNENFLTLKLPDSINLGPPPRLTYPLVVFLIRDVESQQEEVPSSETVSTCFFFSFICYIVQFYRSLNIFLGIIGKCYSLKRHSMFLTHLNIGSVLKTGKWAIILSKGIQNTKYKI